METAKQPQQQPSKMPVSPARGPDGVPSADYAENELEPSVTLQRLLRTPGGIPQNRTADILAIQRTFGNQAAGMLLNRLATPTQNSQAAGAPARESTIERQTPTVDVRDLPMADQDKEKIRTSARDNLPIWVDTFANLWFTATNGALGVTNEPDDPDFKSETGQRALGLFGASLAGNLVWAATCLLAPELTVPIRLMSFGGAVVGSGVVGVLAGDSSVVSSQPSFRGSAATALAKLRDEVVKVSKDKVKDVADECATGNVTDIEEQKKKLWGKMFSTAFNQAAPIESAAASKLSKAAPAFVAQWQAHKASKEVADQAWQRTEERIKRDGYPWSVKLRVLLEPSGPGGPADEYKMQVFNEEKLKCAVETFQPKIDFA
ncbi:MAG: hypothetical protein JOZ87_04500 [Chloroflexi bacterium]|nr:hypothetical protein [Chloroflexota bacterium]